MGVIVFLGSGVSTSLPNVQALTDSILNGKWFHQIGQELGPYHPGTDGDLYRICGNMGERAQAFLHFLIEYQKLFSLTDILVRNYEDLIAVLAFLEENWAARNSTLLGGIAGNQIMGIIQSRGLLAPLSPNGNPLEYSQLLDKSLRFIRWVVHQKLSAPADTSVLDSIRHVLVSSEKNGLGCTIATTNHDCLIESWLDENGFTYQTGFESDPSICTDPRVCFFSSNNFSDNFKVRLLKLHGSVFWWGNNRRPSIYYRGSPSDCPNDINDEQLIPCPYPLILEGTHLKDSFYSFGMWGEIHNRFHEALRESQLIIMSGFGWGDRALSLKLKGWLASNPKNRIALFYKDEKFMAERRACLNLTHDDFARSYRDQLIPMNKWLSEADETDIQSAFQSVSSS